MGLRLIVLGGVFSYYLFAGFGYKRSITIDHTKCGSSNSTDFPVLVYISDATFKTVSNGGHVNNSSGDDIIFYSDSSGTTQIASEIDGYDGTNGVLYAWVKVATLSSSVDTVIYVFYGNASPPSRTTNPWNSNFVGVWHFGSSSSLSLNDSTSTGANFTNSGVSASTGKINGAGSYNGTSNYMYQTPATALKPSSLTVSMWIYDTNLTVALPISMGVSGAAAQTYGYYFSTSNVYFNNNNFGAYATSSISSSTWTHFVGTTSGSGTVYIYKNGSQTAGTAAAALNYTGVNQLVFGASNVPSNYLPGSLDEVRIMNTVVSQDWVTAEYNNTNSPGTFFTIGAEVAISSGGQYRLPMMGVGAI